MIFTQISIVVRTSVRKCRLIKSISSPKALAQRALSRPTVKVSGNRRIKGSILQLEAAMEEMVTLQTDDASDDDNLLSWEVPLE